MLIFIYSSLLLGVLILPNFTSAKVREPPVYPRAMPLGDDDFWKKYIDEKLRQASEPSPPSQIFSCERRPESADSPKDSLGVHRPSLYAIAGHLGWLDRFPTDPYTSEIKGKPSEYTDNGRCNPVFCFAGGIIVSICNDRPDKAPSTVRKDYLSYMILKLARHVHADEWWLNYIKPSATLRFGGNPVQLKDGYVRPCKPEDEAVLGATHTRIISQQLDGEMTNGLLIFKGSWMVVMLRMELKDVSYGKTWALKAIR